MRTVSGDRIVEIASEAQMTARLRPYSDHDRFLLHEIPGYPDHDRPSTVHRFGTRIESNVAKYMISKAPRNRDDARDSGKIRRVFASQDPGHVTSFCVSICTREEEGQGQKEESRTVRIFTIEEEQRAYAPYTSSLRDEEYEPFEWPRTSSEEPGQYPRYPPA